MISRNRPRRRIATSEIGRPGGLVLIGAIISSYLHIFCTVTFTFYSPPPGIGIYLNLGKDDDDVYEIDAQKEPRRGWIWVSVYAWYKIKYR